MNVISEVLKIEEAFDDEAEYKNWKETWFDEDEA